MKRTVVIGLLLLSTACAPSVPQTQVRNINGTPVTVPTARPAQDTGQPEYYVIQQHTMKDGWNCFTYRDKLWCGK